MCHLQRGYIWALSHHLGDLRQEGVWGLGQNLVIGLHQYWRKNYDKAILLFRVKSLHHT
ncbi:unnamed protein product [Acanthoscelides obtectus]|uniref:Uncharacterized protein n=1 Tax=Acanthoscelides obtectus TaxID=200917 RepID=A0A9P0KMN3_ACAOB|nr:unnamed protein product [Acanthoscelides obtectus]CAK1667646.1 hypothetical protein AOBTE_LOCUS25966 [Acanthoscelides obtectus]